MLTSTLSDMLTRLFGLPTLEQSTYIGRVRRPLPLDRVRLPEALLYRVLEYVEYDGTVCLYNRNFGVEEVFTISFLCHNCVSKDVR